MLAIDGHRSSPAGSWAEECRGNPPSNFGFFRFLSFQEPRKIEVPIEAIRRFAQKSGSPVVSNLQTEQFVRLLGKHQQRVYAFILTLVPNWTEAEEVLQETNTVLWRKFDTFDPATDFTRWACQVAYFEVLKYRARQKQDRLVFSEEFMSAVSSDTVAMSDELDVQRHALAACREKLSERDRDLIDRRYQLGATVQSVAAEVGRSVDAVYKALHRIRGVLLSCVRRRIAAEERS